MRVLLINLNTSAHGTDLVAGHVRGQIGDRAELRAVAAGSAPGDRHAGGGLPRGRRGRPIRHRHRWRGPGADAVQFVAALGLSHALAARPIDP
ncbi:hypothetical protein ACLBXO_21215 [Methylobacterium sp. C33D]